MHNTTRSFVSALVALLIATPAIAQLPAARLNGLFPPGGKLGSTVELTATGTDLDGADKLLFSHAGITAKPAGVKGDGTTERSYSVSVGKDVPPGIYEVRAVGRFGATNPRSFVVSTANEVVRTSAPKPDSKDAVLAPGSIVNGRATASAMDTYAIEAKKGQRILVTTAAREIDSKLMPVLAVSDAQGRELERSRRGELIDFTAPEDGTYSLVIHDMLFRGGSEYVYRIGLNTGPHIDFVLPPVGEPGKKQGFTLYGRNLPGGTDAGDIRSADGKPLQKLSVQIDVPGGEAATQLAARLPLPPAAAAIDGFEYRFRDGDASSNPVMITFASSTVVAEADAANDEPAAAQKVSVPCDIAGQFYPRRDRDWYAFEAKKGDVLWFEVTSDRLGIPTGPFLLIQRVTTKDGKESYTDVAESSDTEVNIGGNAFRTTTRDAAVKFEAKEDGSYRVMVRDLFGLSRDDPSMVYRLSIRKPQPDFRVAIIPMSFDARQSREDASLSAPMLRKGGATPLKAIVFRRDGFDGDVVIECEGLAKGLSCNAVTVPGKEALGAIVLAADEKAEPWAGPVKFTAKAKVGGEDVKRDVRFGSVVWGAPAQNNNNAMADPLIARLTDGMMIGLGEEEEPLSLIAGDGGVIEVPEDGKVTIPVKVTRRAEVKAALKVKAIGPDAISKAKEITIDTKANEGKFELDLKQLRVAPGTYTFCLQTGASVKYARPMMPAEAKKPAGKSDGKTDEKKDDKKDEKKSDDKKTMAPKDVQSVFFSTPITLKVTPVKK